MNNNDARQFSCDICSNFTTFSQEAWDAHVQTHLLRCRICEKIFYRRWNLTRHLRYVHGQEVWHPPTLGGGSADSGLNFESDLWEAELILHQDTRLGFHQYEYIIKLKKFTDEENNSLEDRIVYIQRIVTEIGDRCRELLTHPNDKIQLVFNSDPGLISAPFATRFCNRKEFTNKYLLDRANTLLNSNQNFVLSDAFHIGVKIYKEAEIAGGSVPRLSAFNNYEHCLLEKKSIIFLRGGTKNLCFSKSVQILLAQRRYKKKQLLKNNGGVIFLKVKINPVITFLNIGL